MIEWLAEFFFRGLVGYVCTAVSSIFPNIIGVHETVFLLTAPPTVHTMLLLFRSSNIKGAGDTHRLQPFFGP